MPTTAAVLQRPIQSSSQRQQESRELKDCDICDDLHRQVVICLSKEEISNGYFKFAKVLDQPHQGTRHESILKNTMEVFVNKLLGESGNQDGVLATQISRTEEHYNILIKLIRNGADTTNLSMTEGDTPIHAALTVVLDKVKDPSLLEILLDQHQSDSERYSHLNPEQLNQNGECLFHVIAKAKYNSNVLKVTELLCKRNISAHYYDKDGKLPVDYIIKPNCTSFKYLKQADAIKPKREQCFAAQNTIKTDRPMVEDEAKQLSTRSNTEVKQEIVRAISVYERRKKKITLAIKLLPESRVSMFLAEIENSSSIKETTLDISAADGEVSKAESKMSSLFHESVDAEEKIILTGDGESMMDLPDGKNANKNSDVVSMAIDARQEHIKQTMSPHISQEENVESLDELSKHALGSIECLPSDSVDKRLDNVNIIAGTKQVIHDSTLLNSTDICDNPRAGLKVKAQVTSQETTVEKDGNVSDKENSYQTNVELSENKDKTVNQISVIPRQEICNASVKNDIQVSERDVGSNKPVGVEEQDGVNGEHEGQVGHAEENVEDSESEDDLEDDKELKIDAQVFDNLEWEVECTAEVWKTLRDRQVQQELKRRIVHKIQLLATGNWQKHLRKKLKNVPPNLRLFEAKLTKGSRILWELAIAFSPRCSEAAENGLKSETKQAASSGRIYSEIIRVWEIVFDHDKIHRNVEKITRSHNKGETCIIQKNLKGIGDKLGTMSLDKRQYPRLYAERKDTLEELHNLNQEIQRFVPPASANETEYNILKFYPFSSIMVSHVLHNVETKVDFPFRVTDIEHDIIALKSKAPILLMGRSGTGKTTCCLYRLWKQFHSYWTKAKEADAPLMPRCVEFLFPEVKGIDSQDGASVDESEAKYVKEATMGACGGADVNGVEDNEVPVEGNECDHLHQVFITKNSVLCSEVQKNFRELSHADELMEDHVRHEEDSLPARLQDVDDLSYPLFLTSKQLILMLDVSIGAPHFFERKEDGSLKDAIDGWSDIDGPLSFLPLFDEDSDEEEEGKQYVAEDELEDENVRQSATGKPKKVDPRREITYEVFVEEIWPKIRKSMPESYHPSLIWIEIMSFIKGSYEALTKPSGFLQLEEYEQLGRKRAPNFSGQRDIVYNCFKRYEHFKKQHSLFDETDFVYDVFCRLRQMKARPWVIHQIFVDETQDFTQAELCMLIRLCHNPNDMFLTGDTAQSIMRGIAFRFNDLKSLFHHAKQSMQAMGKTSAIEVPKEVYQLKHNYRSHAGILSLASSILELMVDFFPDSFDRLQSDQGLFNGPQPILLESCSFSDLAVLLRGNKRKTSHIEFGAHQAILVVNDAARESIPEELRLGLVLTIYEAKGLEFDDVLLYNFFKDSQANKEWRVVTEYLERMAATQKNTKSSDENKECLVMIDQELLCQSDRPRPLNFDPNQHKVLNSELKHLYTALTRARVNVWIFDEDQDRRAPMFEFFKARNLVKSLIVSEINEESLSEIVFAEKSSCEQWVRRGEDFMKHHLYQAAAKCFGIGQDKDREKVALADHQALLAFRLKKKKSQSRRMREEFLLAADMYLECNKLPEAAKCLQNAREMKLAAELFEKLGQFERAADIYRKMKKPITSSRCYENLGNFNKAIEVLYENENYDLALDTFRRYKMILQDMQQKNIPIPIQLKKPAQHFNEQTLSHRAAEFYHKNKDNDRMLEAVDRFQHVGDQVQFLEEKGYIIEAANMLKKDGQCETAANILLKYGKLEESLLAARTTLDEAVIAHHLLAECRIVMYKERNINLDQKHLLESVKEAVKLFQNCRNNNGFGQARLLQAKLTGEMECIKEAWKAFQTSAPVHNEAGLMDCADWLVRKGNLENLTVLKHVIEGITYVFSMCQALLDTQPSTAQVERVKKLDQYYGLLPCSQETLAVHPMEKPLCMVIVKKMFKKKAYRKQAFVEVRTKELRERMVVYLLERTLDWVKLVSNTLNIIRDKGRVCGYYQAGLDCPDKDNHNRLCYCMHKPHSKDTFQKLIFIDVIFIEMEGSLQAASQLVKRSLPFSILELLKSFVEEGERDLSVKFLACKQLWDDIMPSFGHPALIGGDSQLLVRLLQGNDKVVWRFKQYLDERWADALKEQNISGAEKRLTCKAVRETEVFLLFEFGYHLFGLDHGKIRLLSSPKDEMTRLETALDREVRKKDAKKFKRNTSLMIGYDSKKFVTVECVAKRFTDAYELISRATQPDPYEAVFKFNKFMVQLSLRGKATFLPELKHYLFWIEFYTVLALCIISKLKSNAFPDFRFVLPSSYLQLLTFVEATLPSNSFPIIDGIDNLKSDTRNYTVRLQERLKQYAFTVSGHGQGVILMQEALKLSLKEPSNYGMVERLLILGMTLVCNVGKAGLGQCEITLMGSMSCIEIPSEGPTRLRDVVNMIRESKGIADVVNALKWLLKERENGDEELLVNRWVSTKRQKLESSPLKDMLLFSPEFLNLQTISEMKKKEPNLQETTLEVPDELTDEEIRKGSADKQAEIDRQRCAFVITRFFRKIRDRKRNMSKGLEEKPAESEIDQYFSGIKEDDNKWCGICGVPFKQKLEEDMQFEKSYLDGKDKSGLNDTLKETLKVPPSPDFNWNAPVSPQPFSPDQHKQTAPFPWNKPRTNSFEDKEVIQRRLQNVRLDHIKEPAHIQKCMEFDEFRKNYKELVEPELNKFKGFLKNPDFNLEHNDYREKHYGLHVFEIDRMFSKYADIEKDIQMLIKSRMWSENGQIHQNIEEVAAYLKRVEPYVVEVHAQLKKEKEEKLASLTASASAAIQQSENLDVDEDDIEQIVEEPKILARNRKRRDRRKKRK